MSRIYYDHLDSPVGPILVAGDDKGLVSVQFRRTSKPPDPSWAQERRDVVETAINQIAEYFSLTRTTFDLPLLLEGTDFQRSVWNELLQIPFGETISYGELATKVADETYARAIGTANSQNPLPIIVPCHRVIGNDGSLIGYAGGLDIKEHLLNHEQKNKPGYQPKLFSQ